MQATTHRAFDVLVTDGVLWPQRQGRGSKVSRGLRRVALLASERSPPFGPLGGSISALASLFIVPSGFKRPVCGAAKGNGKCLPAVPPPMGLATIFKRTTCIILLPYFGVRSKSWVDSIAGQRAGPDRALRSQGMPIVPKMRPKSCFIQ